MLLLDTNSLYIESFLDDRQILMLSYEILTARAGGQLSGSWGSLFG